MTTLIRHAVFTLLVSATVSLYGCSMLADTRVATLDRNARSQRRDDRADEAEGLTARDKTARWEEQNLQSIDRKRKSPKRKTTDPKITFKNDWENYLQRNH